MATIIKLKDVQCRHNIPVNTGYHGSTIHVIVFFDPRDKETYIWKATGLAGLGWEEGETYSIIANYEGGQRLSRVKLIKDLPDQDHKRISEQIDQDTQDAFDMIFDTQLTNNESCDIMPLERRKS